MLHHRTIHPQMWWRGRSHWSLVGMLSLLLALVFATVQLAQALSNPFALASLDGRNGFVLTGIAGGDGIDGDNSGWSVSGAGDVNGDGFADLIIGAPLADPAGSEDAGESYVVFGGRTFASSLDLASLDGSNGFILTGSAGGDTSGLSVSGAGDVNNDGFADLIIGAPLADPAGRTSAGESYVVFGSQSFGSPLDLASLDGSNGFVLAGVAGGDAIGGDNSGWSVSGAGDVNGDGFADLIIGAPEADPAGGDRAGESYVVFGGRTFASSLDLALLDRSDGFVLTGGASDDYSGWSVSGAGDVNGDGFADLIIGAPEADPAGRTSAGESYVVFGGSTFDSSLDLAGLDGSNGFVLTGIDAGDFSGNAVSGAGDVNGDGSADLLIGAPEAAPAGNSQTGASYVVFSAPADTTPPEVSITDPPASTTSATSASVSFSATDGSGSGIAGYTCRLDDGAWAVCSSPVSYTGLRDGLHTVHVQATDQAGNMATASYTWMVDTTTPTVTVAQGEAQADPTGTASLVFDIAFNEDVSGFDSSDVILNGSAPGSLSASVSGGPRTYTVTVSGMTGSGTVTATIPANAATDVAGNGNPAVPPVTITYTAAARTLYLPLIQHAAALPDAAFPNRGMASP